MHCSASRDLLRVAHTRNMASVAASKVLQGRLFMAAITLSIGDRACGAGVHPARGTLQAEKV